HMNSRARTALSARKHERFERCVDGLEPGMAAALRTLLSRCEALGRAVREDLLQALNKRFPVIRQQEEIAPWSQEDVIYVTRAGLLRRQAEIDEHINVKMKENARAIGRAAEHGDLSENSEYKFALEERDLLRGRLAQMNDELQRARVITPQDVPTDHIGIGTKATFERVSDGRRFVMSFVGPWEARGELGLFNYKSPLAQRLMGTRIGDVVSFELSDAQGEYKLVELCPALEE
ncbi:MAG: GreA/GreB family elongation factor, partial [Phycisphaerae bacterium]